MNRNY